MFLDCGRKTPCRLREKRQIPHRNFPTWIQTKDLLAIRANRCNTALACIQRNLISELLITTNVRNFSSNGNLMWEIYMILRLLLLKHNKCSKKDTWAYGRPLIKKVTCLGQQQRAATTHNFQSVFVDVRSYECMNTISFLTKESLCLNLAWQRSTYLPCISRVSGKSLFRADLQCGKVNR